MESMPALMMLSTIREQLRCLTIVESRLKQGYFHVFTKKQIPIQQSACVLRYLQQ